MTVRPIFGVWLVVLASLSACSNADEATGESGSGAASGSVGTTTGGTSAGATSGGGKSGDATGGSGGSTAGGSGGSATGGSGGAATDGSAGSAMGGAAGSAAGADAGPPCSLNASQPVTTTADGQIIELLRIDADSVPGIDVRHKGVVVRNVEIHHRGAAGISFSNADDLTIENAVVLETEAPASGPNPSSELVNIVGYQSQRVQIKNVRLTRGSSGIYLVECPSSTLSFVEGHDFRGPFPRGQLVQWDKSNDGVLEDFSVENPASSWPEDDVNVYQSTGAQIRRGLVDGDNSPSGVGVIFDGGFSTGIVEDVDAIHMGNGCFSDYAGGEGVVFRRTRCRDNICTDQGRGVPSSNGLMWAGNLQWTALRIEQSAYFAACNPDNIVWPTQSFAIIELSELDFALRAPLRNAYCWE